MVRALQLQPLLRVPVLLLIAANIIPLYGVWELGWGVFELILVYWLENVVIGVLNLLKMALSQGSTPFGWVEKVVALPFFTFHYGMFTMIHGIFVIVLFGPESFKLQSFEPDALLFSDELWAIEGFKLVLLALVLSHAAAFYWDFVRNGAYAKSELKKQMHEPYKRVIVLHLTIIFGGFLVMALQEPLWALVVMIVIKVIIDIISLRKSEQREVGDG